MRFARVRRVMLPPRRLEPRGSPEPLAWASSIDQKSFAEKVKAVHQLIRDGVCYQINLTRRLSVSYRIDPRTLFEALESINRSPRSFMLWLGETAVVSASPERFLYRNGSHVETSPIKGTGTSRRALLASTKDRAENVMIVDLARNDLGRICQPGSISVPALCVPELYPGVVHLVSTVAGTLKPDIGSDEMLQALFPPASITGAPKPSVMQAIVDLEPVPPRDLLRSDRMDRHRARPRCTGSCDPHLHRRTGHNDPGCRGWHHHRLGPCRRVARDRTQGPQAGPGRRARLGQLSRSRRCGAPDL